MEKMLHVAFCFQHQDVLDQYTSDAWLVLHTHSLVSRLDVRYLLIWHGLGSELSHLGASVGSCLTLLPTAFLEHLVYN